jgi:hypothetical protein
MSDIQISLPNLAIMTLEPVALHVYIRSFGHDMFEAAM